MNWPFVMETTESALYSQVPWKVPENQFTQKQKVTLRRILSHSAGLTVHGFPGYAVDAPLPSLVRYSTARSPRILRQFALT